VEVHKDNDLLLKEEDKNNLCLRYTPKSDPVEIVEIYSIIS